MNRNENYIQPDSSDLSIDTEKQNKDFKRAEFWAAFGVIGNILLTIVKAAAGIIGGSSAMIADSVHSASDIVASTVVFFSLKIAKKPADEDHPYGHGKAEAIAASVVGMLLVAAGFQILKTAIFTIRAGSVESPGMIALYAAILSIVVKELMYRITYKVGVEINSPSTIANAHDHRSDAFSSIATFIGIGGAIMGFPIMDPIAGGIVALFILKMGYDITVDASHQIMDKSVDNSKIALVKETVLSTPGVVSAHDIRVIQSGPFYRVDLDICVDENLTLKTAHIICDSARSNVFKSMEKVIDVRIHVDPFFVSDQAQS